MIRFIPIFLAAPALADEQRVWPGTVASGFEPSIVSIHAPTRADAVASVTFENTPVHWRDETFALEWQGIAVTVELDWQFGDSAAERIAVYPPEGYVAVPPSIIVDEGQAMTLHIVKWEGM